MKKNGLHIDEYGIKCWYKDDELHSLDSPAVEYPDGTKAWWMNGSLHRLDGPAFEHADGDKEWWMNGSLHRLDGPAFEHADGDKEWWMNNKFLGYDEEGFWTLWDLLTDEQRNNLNLHMYLPKVVR